MTKSFKDNYAEMVVKPTVVKPTITNEGHADSVEIKPTVDPVEIEQVKLEPINIGNGLPIREEVVVQQPIRVELTEEIADILTEQREQSAKVLESVMKTNTKIANSVTKLVKDSTETNTKLVEAILGLTEKIGLLEAKLEAIENLEIPTPIVQIQQPSTRIHKEIHRDKKGIITHITESEVPLDEEDGGE